MNLANIVAIQNWNHVNRDVAMLDPLQVDACLPIVHEMNRANDAHSITALLLQSLPDLRALHDYDYCTAIAVMRDLGMFMGSLKRLGIEPVQALPELEYTLNVLKTKTELPSGPTVHHYSVWNPAGGRMRSFTGQEDEIRFFTLLRAAWPILLEATVYLDLMHDAPLQGNDFEENCALVRSKLEALYAIQAPHHRRATFCIPEQLRPYLRRVCTEANHDAGDQYTPTIPVFIFEHLFWGCDNDDTHYNRYKEFNLPYTIPLLRDLHAKYVNRPSLVSKVECQLRKGSNKNYRAAKAVLELSYALKLITTPGTLVEEPDAYHERTTTYQYEAEANIHDYTRGLRADRLAQLQIATTLFRYNEVV